MTFVDTLGMGLYMTGAVVFFTRSLHFSPAFIGIAMTIAGIVGLTSTVPAGRLSDRFGPKQTFVPTYMLLAILFGLLPFADSKVSFVVVISAISFLECACRPIRGAAFASLVDGKSRVAAVAYNRAVLNVGVSVGALGAGVALAIGSTFAFHLMIWANALSFVYVAIRFARLPLAPLSKETPTHTGRLFSPRLVAAALSCGVLYMNAALLDIGLPLQVSTQTTAPRWVVAALLLVNTTLAILFQVKASRDSETLMGAARANRRAGLSLLVACLLFGLAAVFDSAIGAVVALVFATIALTGGELFSSAGKWGMSVAMAPADRRAEFLGGFELVSSAPFIFGPICAALVVAHGTAAWIVAGVIFLGAGLASPLIARSAKSEYSLPVADSTT